MTDPQSIPQWFFTRIDQVKDSADKNHERLRNDLNKSVDRTSEELEKINERLRLLDAKITRFETERQLGEKWDAKKLAVFVVVLSIALQTAVQLVLWLMGHKP